MRRPKGIFQKIDWWLIILFLLLVLIGWLNIYAAVYDEEHTSILDIQQRYGKQLIFILAAMLIALATLSIDQKFFNSVSYIIYGTTILILVVVIFIGKEVSGSKSWIHIGGFGFQPAEFAKTATALVLARFLSSLEVDFRKPKYLIISFLLFLIPCLLVLMQHDTGSALVFFAFILVLYRAGLTGFVLLAFVIIPVLGVLALLVPKLILAGVILLICIVLFLRTRRRIRNLLLTFLLFLASTGFVFSVDYVFNRVLQPHQQQRIKVLLWMETDVKGAGYNVNQSLIAIGSGRLTGKGYLQGTQTKYNFVPEQSTDFIFCTIGEEWGFIGSFIIILLFTALFVRIILIAERQRAKFSRYFGYGLASVLFFHFAINIGMPIGLLPVICIPLPFISYGGSSLWAFTLMLFIFIRQDSKRYELV